MHNTIKDIYKVNPVKDPKTSLLKHYNLVLGKTVEELNESDVCMLIRQELFTDISIPLAIKMIKENHSAGDNYEYCLLANLSKMNLPFGEFKLSLFDLVGTLEKDFSAIDFESESDKNDYLESISRLKNKIGKCS